MAKIIAKLAWDLEPGDRIVYLGARREVYCVFRSKKGALVSFTDTTFCRFHSDDEVQLA